MSAGLSILNAPKLVAPFWYLLAYRQIYNPGAILRLGLASEQAAREESYIALSEERDALGIRKARIHWQLSAQERRTFSVYAQAMRGEFERLKLGRIELAPWILDETLPWEGAVVDQYHHMGATCMARNAAEGVVDTDCFVHGVKNLAVASASVFPTSGHSNPTLTLLALSMRLADELKRRLKVGAKQGP